MTWLIGYLVIGFITTLVLIRMGMLEKGDEQVPAILAFVFWPFFIIIFGIVGAYRASEWIFFGISDLIDKLPRVRFGSKDE